MTVLAFIPKPMSKSESEKRAAACRDGIVSIVYDFEFEKHKRDALAAELGSSVRFLASDEELRR